MLFEKKCKWNDYNTSYKTSHKLKWNVGESVMCMYDLICYIFLANKWLKGRSFLLVHSCNKSNPHVYLKLFCLSGKCEQCKSSIAVFSYQSLSNVAIVSLVPQLRRRTFSTRYSISSVSDCFPNWSKRFQPHIW